MGYQKYLHKIGTPLCPLISQIDIPTYKVAKHIAKVNDLILAKVLSQEGKRILVHIWIIVILIEYKLFKDGISGNWVRGLECNVLYVVNKLV